MLASGKGQAERAAGPSPVSDRQLRDKQVEVLFDQLQVALSASTASALIMVGVFWAATAQIILIAWLAVFALLTALRWITQYCYNHSDKAGTRTSDFWLSLFIAEACCAGAVWCGAILLLPPEGSLLYLGLIVLWVCGLCAGAIASLSIHRGAFIAFALPALLPAAIELLLSSRRAEVTVGAGILIYLGFILLNSQRMHQTLLQSLKLQFKNEQLIHHLDAERAGVEKLNNELERKVVLRTSDLSRMNMRLQKEVRERKRAQHSLLTHVRHLENMNHIMLAVGETFDPDEVLDRIIRKTRTILKADSVWLLHPSDPQLKCWRVAVESTATGCPALSAAGGELPTDTQSTHRLLQALETNKLIVQHRISEPSNLERRYSMRSQMVIALRPQFGEPWLLGVHQRSHSRHWSDEEQCLFKDIALRLINLLGATYLQRELKQSEERLRLALESARIGLWDWNIRSGETYFNPLWQNQIGCEPGDIVPHIHSWRARIHPYDSSNVLRELDAYLDGAKPYFETEYRLCTKQGRWIWVQSRGEIVERDRFGRPLRLVGTQIDTSQRKQTEEKLKLDAAVFANTSEGVIITDAKFHVLAVNRAFTDITGYPPREVLGRVPAFMRFQDKKGQSLLSKFLTSLKRTGRWQGEILNQRKNGERYPQWTNIAQIKGARTPVSNYVFVFSDITDLKASQKRLEHLAHHDALTHLPNRLLFSIRLEYALERSRREGGRVAVLFLDLDRFKHVNDSLGHQAGDALLVRVSERLKKVVRAEDTVARQSGDEFMILLENLVKSRAAATVAAKSLEVLNRPFNLEGKVVYITASIGISLYPDDAQDAVTLHKNADIALYRAKEHGRSNYQFFTKELTLAAAERAELESSLRNALQNEEFELFFQPQLSLNENVVAGVESLLRWHHPEHGLLMPAQFLPLAEETGLILELGHWALRNACAQASLWKKQSDSPLPVSVNISLLQLLSGDLPKQVEQLLAEFALSPAALELEVGEVLFAQQSSQIAETLHRLRALGVSVAIDDFGKSYSSLSSVKQFKPNTLKIDRSFVANISQDKVDLAVVSTIGSLAKNLNLKVVAKGVETTQQLHLLRGQECDLAQGFLFCAPVNAIGLSGFVRRLAARHG